MPTVLPSNRHDAAKPVKQKQTLVSILFNVFMVASALALTFVVLLTQARYAFGPRDNKPAVTLEQNADSHSSR